MQRIGQLSVTWQRELLEHLGVQMDFGCRALSEIPHRFGSDQELLASFQQFQMACSKSAQLAMQRHSQRESTGERAEGKEGEAGAGEAGSGSDAKKPVDLV